MHLNDSIQEPVKHELEEQLIHALWNPSGSIAKRAGHTGTYLRYYHEQCQQSLVDRGRYSSARTHGNIVDSAELVKQGLAYDEITQNLRSKSDAEGHNATDEALKGTINLVARVLSMMKVGTWRYEFSGHNYVDWTQGSLQQCIAHWFKGPVLDHDNVKLEKLFNGANLGTIAGLKIVWTDNIAEHLSLQENDQEVAIFHHASYLKDHGM